MTLFELRGPAELVETESRRPVSLGRLLLGLLDRFRGAHYDTIAARQNRRPIATWTPNGWV
ncbi:hypothetical protein CCR97_22985 [Rhodoplanes elegans]|uniref:Uncharacterized protein n=1 Tax=Rhodoplanes elegans TaxID=29408 RepID=A0A327KC05_9BRAD|nr:hypothetical protein [Rhodoplanes elegans]MBK5961046.1 hypothetical protein [Rhodoplanes elegans]RAI35153.1 hypothetical protein CH338_19750 [Rhodoplanes elegans]